MDKFRDMKLLSAVVEKGNFAQAAKTVDLTPAMVGRRIAAMEEALGFVLFNRSTRRMELTPGGRTYYEGCKRILAEVSELEESVTSAHQTNPKGLIRLSAPEGLGSPFLIGAIKHFRQQYPDIRFDLDLSNRPLDLVKDRIDLSLRIAIELEDSSLVATTLGHTSFGLYASEDYLQQYGTPKQLDELQQYDCIHMGSSKYGDYWTVIQNGNMVNVKHPWVLVVPNTACLIQAVTDGMGIAMIPEMFAKPHVEANRMVQINEVAEFPQLTVYGLYPTRKHLPYRVRLFLDFLKGSAPAHLCS